MKGLVDKWVGYVHTFARLLSVPHFFLFFCLGRRFYFFVVSRFFSGWRAQFFSGLIFCQLEKFYFRRQLILPGQQILFFRGAASFIRAGAPLAYLSKSFVFVESFYFRGHNYQPLNTRQRYSLPNRRRGSNLIISP